MTEKYIFTINIDLHPDINQSKLNRLGEIELRDYLEMKFIATSLKDKIDKKYKISRTFVNNLFLTSKKRPKVEFDLKKQFEGYTREHQEIIENVIEMIHSHKSNKNEYPFSNTEFNHSTRRMRYVS